MSRGLIALGSFEIPVKVLSTVVDCEKKRIYSLPQKQTIKEFNPKYADWAHVKLAVHLNTNSMLCSIENNPKLTNDEIVIRFSHVMDEM